MSDENRANVDRQSQTRLLGEISCCDSEALPWQVERKTGQRFYTNRILAKCDYPKTKIIEEGKWVAYLIPHDVVFKVPCDRNKPNATYWLEADDDEPFHEKILEDFEIELSDFWDGEPSLTKL